MHGNKSQSQRRRALADFERGKCDTLVATDVASRGIDVEDITHVINFDAPEDRDTYVHRTGRTGRAGASGIAASFVLPDQHGEMRKIADGPRAARGVRRRPRIRARRSPALQQWRRRRQELQPQRPWQREWARQRQAPQLRQRRRPALLQRASAAQSPATQPLAGQGGLAKGGTGRPPRLRPARPAGPVSSCCSYARSLGSAGPTAPAAGA